MSKGFYFSQRFAELEKLKDPDAIFDCLSHVLIVLNLETNLLSLLSVFLNFLVALDRLHCLFQDKSQLLLHTFVLKRSFH